MPENLENWFAHIQKYRLPVYRQALKYIELRGYGVEIGAGSSWFSSMVSKIPEVIHITAIDIKKDRLDTGKIFARRLGANLEKISFLPKDFHQLPFPDQSMSFVLSDAAIHHSKTPQVLLKEIRRVLRPDGVFIAIREPILPSFPVIGLWRLLTFGLKERLRGEIEKIYSLGKWLELFNSTGLGLEIRECLLDTTKKEKLIKKFKQFNGLLFNRYLFIARKQIYCNPKRSL